MRTAPPGLPWYQRPVVIILTLVFVAPLGLAKTYTVAAPEGGK